MSSIARIRKHREHQNTEEKPTEPVNQLTLDC